MAKTPTTPTEEALDTPKSYIITKRDGRRFRVKDVASFRKDGSGHHFVLSNGNHQDYGDGELTSAVLEGNEEEV